jgi:uncharacterized protein YgiM (DUF1202 family)
MDWVNSRVDSWTRFVGITFVILALFLIISCNPSTSNNPSGSTNTPMPVTTIALVSIATPVQSSIPASATRMPTPTDTPIPAYPALTLVNPAPGATIVGKEKTEFSWEWDGDLQEEQAEFYLRIWRLEKPPSTFAIGCECSILIDTPPDGFGDYMWQVAVVRTDKDGNKSILSESRIWEFVWSDMTPPPTPIPIKPPTPTSTYTPIPEAVVVWEGGLNLRSGPGIIYDIIGFLSKDEILDIKGRIASNEWMNIVSVTNPDKLGWASALPQYVQINVDWGGIPIVEMPPTPTPISTLTATPTLTPVLLPAPIPKWPLTEENARQVQTVEVRWEWIGGPLVGDETFSVNIEPQGFVCPAGHPHTQIKDTTFRAEMSCPSGRYAWYVKLVVPDNTSTTGWRELSDPSAPQYFDFALPGDGGDGGNDRGHCVPPLCP